MSSVAQRQKKILIVDDEEDVTDLLQYNLKANGFDVKAINDPLLFMGSARDFQPDMFILDIMMPELSGFQICRMLRADSTMKHLPIIFLTAKGETEDRIKGLETGADDYVCKPFDMREIILRINAIFARDTRSEITEPSSTIRIGEIEIDSDAYTLQVAGEVIDLTATEFRLLKLLMSRKGRVQSRENLLVNVWNYESDIETRTVDTHVRRLREKLGAHGNIIETVRGVGYRIVEAQI